MHFTLERAHVPLFVRCLETLPNLHTLEVAEWDSSSNDQLRVALWCVELPQVKVLILPATAHSLLKHCPNVEDVVWVTRWPSLWPDAPLRSLTSNRDSKVRRLAIPLVGWNKPSRKLSLLLCAITT